MKTPEQRWKQGFEHHPKSIKLCERIQELDQQINNDYFYDKFGAEESADSFEILIYLLDEIFEQDDEFQKEKEERGEHISNLIDSGKFDEAKISLQNYRMIYGLDDALTVSLEWELSDAITWNFKW